VLIRIGWVVGLNNNLGRPPPGCIRWVLCRERHGIPPASDFILEVTARKGRILGITASNNRGEGVGFRRSGGMSPDFTAHVACAME